MRSAKKGATGDSKQPHLQPDYLIVGSGLTGAVIARRLHDAGQRVLIVEKRPLPGGNVRDEIHPSGIRMHTYGPHYFRTSDKRIWDFVQRFSAFQPYTPCLKTWVDGRYENWPLAASYIARTIGPHWIPAFQGKPSNFEEAALALMPEPVYRKFVHGYTLKQWGKDPRELSAQLARRFDVRPDDDPRLMPRKKYQGIPAQGYATWINRMLEGIPLLLNTDYLAQRDAFQPRKKTVFTGPIDAFFDYALGKLAYRGQQRHTEYLPDTEWHQPCAQVNNPLLENGPHIRTLEWKHLLPPAEAARIPGTLITRETTYSPENPDAFEYPFPDAENAQRYQEYRRLASQRPDVLICGRLGEYRYFDMDQAIARAWKWAQRMYTG